LTSTTDVLDAIKHAARYGAYDSRAIARISWLAQ